MGHPGQTNLKHLSTFPISERASAEYPGFVDYHQPICPILIPIDPKYPDGGTGGEEQSG